MSPKQALRILAILVIIIIIVVLIFYVVNKLFLEELRLNEGKNNIMQTDTEKEEKGEVEEIEISEEEKSEIIEQEIEEKAAELIEKDKKENGKITPATRRAIQDMVNNETRRKEALENESE